MANADRLTEILQAIEQSLDAHDCDGDALAARLFLSRFHVLTFSAVRGTMAIGALERAGVDDLGSGDPMHFVGGSGDDATTISRRFVAAETS